MSDTPTSGKPRKDGAKRPATGQSRDDRLKAALKANMARRKAQSKARQASAGADDGTEQDGA